MEIMWWLKGMNTEVISKLPYYRFDDLVRRLIERLEQMKEYREEEDKKAKKQQTSFKPPKIKK